jgi:hypothetical protein
MTFLSESQTKQTALAGALSAGLDNIRYGQEIAFTPYIRLVLPIDGFVFWVRYDQVGAETLKDAGLLDEGAQPITVDCDIHMATSTDQSEDENIDVSNVVVTTKQEVRPFHDAIVTVMWLAESEGVRFAINSRKSFSQQANVFHYVGKTIYPAMMTQIIDDASQFNLRELVLSNSTALWLFIASDIHRAVWLPGFTFPLFPKYLIPDNLDPPYGVVSPLEGTIRGINLAPTYSLTFSRDHFVEEEVDIILYGCPHRIAADFVDSVLGYTLAETTFGIQNTPTIKDEPRQQTELSVLAQKKRINFKINFHQRVLRDMAIRLITKCVPNITLLGS